MDRKKPEAILEVILEALQQILKQQKEMQEAIDAGLRRQKEMEQDIDAIEKQVQEILDLLNELVPSAQSSTLTLQAN